jgi:hypothetical protein
MTESDEQTLPLTIFSNTQKEDKIIKYFNFDNDIQTIHRIGPYGNIKGEQTDFSCLKSCEIT